MHKLKRTAAIFVVLLLFFALLCNLATAERRGIKGELTTICANSYAFLKCHVTKKKVTQVPEGPAIVPDAVVSKTDTSVATTSRYCPLNDMDAHVDQYLAWQGEAWAKLVAWGRALTMGYPPPGMLLPTDPALIEACYIAYDSARLRCFLELYNRTASPYYGREVEVVRYLRSRGRDWFTAITIMELESTCGMAAGGNDYGILDSRFQPGNVENWCDYLDYWQVATFGYTSNELPKIAQVYNDHQAWRANFYQLAGDLRTWYP